MAMRASVLLLLCVSVAAIRRSSRQTSSSVFHRRRRTASMYENLPWKEHYQKMTADMSKTKNELGMRPSCEPIFEEPVGESQGMILLQHGFTACAGFWYMLVPRLVQAGWTVLAPNLPGHGRTQHVEKNGSSYVVTDYIEELPEWGTEYERYSQELVEITRKYKEQNANKKMAMVGCSHGGAVAVYVAMTNLVGTFDRIMLLNPFLSPPTSLGADYGLSFLNDMIPQVLPAFSIVAGDRVGWGPECEELYWPDDPRQGGHGGYCQFSLESMRATLEFGNLVEGEARARAAELGVFTGGLVDRAVGVAQLLTHMAWDLVAGGGETPPSNLKVQIVTTSGDGAISNERVHFLASALEASAMGHHSGFCGLDREFEHTYINPIDKPLDADLWWLDPTRVEGGKSLLDMLEAFVSKGTLLPTSGTIQDDKALKGDPHCAVSKKGR